MNEQTNKKPNIYFLGLPTMIVVHLFQNYAVTGYLICFKLNTKHSDHRLG